MDPVYPSILKLYIVKYTDIFQSADALLAVPLSLKYTNCINTVKERLFRIVIPYNYICIVFQLTNMHSEMSIESIGCGSIPWAARLRKHVVAGSYVSIQLWLWLNVTCEGWTKKTATTFVTRFIMNVELSRHGIKAGRVKGRFGMPRVRESRSGLKRDARARYHRAIDPRRRLESCGLLCRLHPTPTPRSGVRAWLRGLLCSYSYANQGDPAIL